MVPDDALLEIFYFCADVDDLTKNELEAWQTLVHVCRRWRNLVFGSPRRLNLQLVCSAKLLRRNALDVWPTLPLIIRCHKDLPIESMGNVVAALGHSNRMRQIGLEDVSSLYLEKVSAAMQVPFPELTHLYLSSNEETMPVLPNSFLGGSTPRLEDLYFRGIPFPGLPKLLLTAPHLVDLHLYDIPDSGYFSPEAIVTALSTQSSLRSLRLKFQSPRSRPSWASRYPPPTRSVLPVFTTFDFRGVSEYLDDFVARIDAPRLIKLDITFFNQIIFDTPQLIQFVSRTPTLRPLETASVIFMDGSAGINLSSQTFSFQGFNVRIPCGELDWQVSSLEQICTSCLPPLSILEDLYISEFLYWEPGWQDNIDGTLWLELLRPFIAVKKLYLSEEVAQRIVPALQELVGGRATEVLPTLQDIFLERGLPRSGPVQKGIGQFLATRQAASGSHPIVVVSDWDRIPPRQDFADKASAARQRR